MRLSVGRCEVAWLVGAALRSKRQVVVQRCAQLRPVGSSVCRSVTAPCPHRWARFGPHVRTYGTDLAHLCAALAHWCAGLSLCRSVCRCAGAAHLCAPDADLWPSAAQRWAGLVVARSVGALWGEGRVCHSDARVVRVPSECPSDSRVGLADESAPHLHGTQPCLRHVGNGRTFPACHAHANLGP